MKKPILMLIFFFSVTLSFANEIPKITEDIKETTKTISKTNVLTVDECSVTSSGTVEMAGGGSFQATLTVTGPCDASLAQKMRHLKVIFFSLKILNS